jgi:formaldehyde-activating enzyme involved in methanogenesis
MPYEKELDECVIAKSWENDQEKLTASVYSYNKGTKKLQLTRENKNSKGEPRFAKLGRLTKEEIDAFLPLIKEVRTRMD